MSISRTAHQRTLLPALIVAATLAAAAPQDAFAQHRGPGWGYGGHGHYGGRGWGYGHHVGVLPALATILTIGALTYWVADGVYYRADPYGGYVVVPSPVYTTMPAAVASPPPAQSERLYAYPRNAQPSARQSEDEYECHRWAVAQIGFDPVAAATGHGTDAAQRSNYLRAQSACLEGRGYTVR